jgi:putative copper export protein
VLGGLTGTTWGRLWAAHGVALAIATVVLVTMLGRPRTWQRPVAGLAVVCAATADAAAGHAADLPRDSATAVLATAVHVLGAGVWAGSLLVLAVSLLPVMRRHPGLRRPLLASTWRAFSPVAAGASALVLASGLYLVGREVLDLHAVTSTVYGAAAAGKLVAVVIVLGTASMTTLLVNPGLARRATVPRSWFGRLVSVELGVLLLALGLASLMGSVPTARERAVVSQASGPRTATVDGLFVTFEEVTAGAGESRVIVRVNAVTRPQPGPVTGSDVLLVGPEKQSVSVVLRRIEEGRFEGTAPTLGSGTWTAWIAMRRPSVPDAIAEVGWTVATGQATSPTTLERLTTALALLFAAVPAALALVLHRRGRTRTASGQGAVPAEPEPARERVGA